ncbi:MAG: hypothetical protein ACI9KE_005832 [Polyangiales bacterium]|jgi:hypothetical protein
MRFVRFGDVDQGSPRTGRHWNAGTSERERDEEYVKAHEAKNGVRRLRIPGGGIITSARCATQSTELLSQTARVFSPHLTRSLHELLRQWHVRRAKACAGMQHSEVVAAITVPKFARPAQERRDGLGVRGITDLKEVAARRVASGTDVGGPIRAGAAALERR